MLAAAAELRGRGVWAVVPDGTPQEAVDRFRAVWQDGPVYVDAGLGVPLHDVSTAGLLDPRLWMRGFQSRHHRGSTSDLTQGGKMGALVLVGPDNSVARAMLQTSMHDEATPADLEALTTS